MRVVVAGGTGLVGRALVSALLARGDGVTVLSRSPAAAIAGAEMSAWDGRHVDERVLAGTDAVVNLSGESLGGRRWSERRKRRILDSRVDSTGALVAAVGRLDPQSRPRTFVNASGVGFAGDRGDDLVDEDTPRGTTFLSSVCAAWEKAAAPAEAAGLRVVLMRTALAISRDAPAFRLMALPFRLFVGGPLGSGRQWLPWIHLDDLVRLYVQALEDETLRGPVHAVAPEAVRQRDLAKAIAAALHRPALVPAPAILLRLALGDQSQLLLDSQHAVSRKLEPGAFAYATLDSALEEALG